MGKVSKLYLESTTPFKKKKLVALGYVRASTKKQVMKEVPSTESQKHYIFHLEKMNPIYKVTYLLNLGTRICN